jgi:hypothetical protein
MYKKFEEIIDLDEWEIDTPSGFQSIKNIMQTIPYEKYIVNFESGNYISGADTHILIDINDNEVYIKDLVQFDKIKSRNGFEIVKEVIRTGIFENMYDVEIESDEHLYYANDLVSHNTITISACLLISAMFNNDQNIAILANKASTAKSILQKIKLMFEHLPEFLKLGVTEWNKTSICFSNGSRIFSAASSSDSVRGEAISICYIDEAAFLPNPEEFYTSTYPTITSGENSKIIMTSTPCGLNMFYKIFTEAKNNINNYIALEYDWRDDPRKKPDFKEKTIANTSILQFEQEFECHFHGSSNTLISGKKLEQLTYINPIEIIDKLKIYKYPIEHNKYVLSIDVSEGIQKDYSVCSVIDITNKISEVVAVYRNNEITPYDFTRYCVSLGKKYNDAYLLIENNSIGKIVADSAFNDYDYENIISDLTANNFRIGVRTNSAIKKIGCSSLKTLIENDMIILNDFDLMSEIFSFIKHKSSYAAEQSKTDDIVMTLVLFSWFIQEQHFQDYTEMSFNEIMNSEDDDHLIYGFMDDGLEDASNLL